VHPYGVSAVVLTAMLRRKDDPVEREIVRVVLPVHPRLGRHVHHDSESRRYRVARPEGVALTSVRHESFIDILDQGQLGSCTGNAGLSAVYHRPYVDSDIEHFPAFSDTEADAVGLYSAATKIDPFAGEYKPTDTGSDGLSIAKVLKAKGVISGYLWAFTLDEALAQLMQTPLITGVPWLNSMFNTTTAGHAGHVVINETSGLAGGHEICVDELVVGSDPGRADWFVGGPNSWGTSWGDGGRWYWTVPEWGWLLAQQGDVTAFVEAAEPTPTPGPPPTDPAGDALWKAMRSWSHAPHTGGNARAARAARDWAKATGRS
jgi:hypothetical protein